MNILRHMRWSFFVLLLCGGVFLFHNTNAYSITADPYFRDMSVSSGEKTKNSFSLIMKNSSEPKRFVATIHNFIVKEDGKTPEVVSTDLADPDITSWVTMKDNGAYLVSDSPARMEYEVSVPAGTPSGTYHVGFRVTSQKSDGGEDSVSGRMFLPIFITVDKEKAQRGVLMKGFYVEKDFLYGDPLKIHTKVKNIGVTDEKPYGDILIKNVFGKTVARLFLNEELGRVLPGSSREFNIVWNGAKDWYRFGLYKASVFYSINEDKKTPVQNLNVWIFSPIITTVGVLVILSIIISTFLYKRKKQK